MSQNTLISHPLPQTCRRTILAGTVEPPWGSWAGARRAWGPEWPHCLATLPIAPESFAAVMWPWSPAPSAEPFLPHTGTPTMPAPMQQSHGGFIWTFSGNNRQKMNKSLFFDTVVKIFSSYLYIGKVNTIEIAEHLVDLWCVLQHSTCRLSQVVQRCISAQCLRKGTNSGNLLKETRAQMLSFFKYTCIRIVNTLVCSRYSCYLLINRSVITARPWSYAQPQSNKIIWAQCQPP